MRLLLIEDDNMIGRGLVEALGREAMTVDWVRTAQSGAEALAVGGHALVLLDLGLPDMPGLDLLGQARKSGNRTPVFIITARDAADDRVAGLDLGADDYLVKPFEIRELVARIRAVLRRHAGKAQSVFEAGDLSLNLASHELSCRGTSLVLPAREFGLMVALMERPGTILSRSQIEDRLYESNLGSVYSSERRIGTRISGTKHADGAFGRLRSARSIPMRLPMIGTNSSPKPSRLIAQAKNGGAMAISNAST